MDKLDLSLNNEDFYKRYGRKKTVAFYTLGCKVNQYETESMIESFEREGYQVVDYNGFSDIYIINTCTVTNMGDRKSRQIIRKALTYNENSFIAVVGCYSQIAPESVLEIKGVKLILGTDNRTKIVDLVEEAISEDKRINAVTDIMQVNKFEEMGINQYKDRTRAFVKIQEGCDQYCSYCIIPYTRGHIRSRSIKSIIEEIEVLAQNGFIEVVLTGIHIGSYGKDINDIRLIDVIENVHKIDGIERIRISSVEPNTLNREFIYRISKLEKVCRHFHISLQSGCDETLKRMNRKYTTESYKKAVDNLRNAFDDVGITTDLIVGFPGETEEEFNKTMEFINIVSFSSMHIFKYSPRKGTPAARHPNQISGKIKEVRSKKVYELAEKSERKFLDRFLNKKIKVLFEHGLRDNNNYYEGLTHNYIRVIARSELDISGKLLNVMLKEVRDNYIIGELIKE